MRILLVDDNPMNSALARAALEQDGYELAFERDGRSALARAMAESFDLILLDIELPGLRGDAICGQLRAAGHREPILALTASALPEQLADLERVGFDLILTKPIDPDALRAAVKRFEQTSMR